MSEMTREAMEEWRRKANLNTPSAPAEPSHCTTADLYELQKWADEFNKSNPPPPRPSPCPRPCCTPCGCCRCPHCGGGISHPWRGQPPIGTYPFWY
jgi:hypothetical protein